MRRLLVGTFIVFSAATPSVYAGEIISFICNPKNDTLSVKLSKTTEEKQTPKDSWNPWDLTVDADDGRHIKSVKTVTRTCELSDGAYNVQISADPCNYDTLGHNGAMMMSRAKVMKGSVKIANELFGSCSVIEGMVTTEMIIKAGQTKPKIVEIRAEDWFD